MMDWCYLNVLKKGHIHVSQRSLSLSLLSNFLTLTEICSDEEQHESSPAQLTHKSHTHTHKSRTRSQSSHKQMQSVDVEKSSARIEHSVIPRTLLKEHVGESRLNSFMFSHTHMWEHTHLHEQAQACIVNTAWSCVLKWCDGFWELSWVWVVVVFHIQGLWLKVIKNERESQTRRAERGDSELLRGAWECACVRSGGEYGQCLSREPVL